MEGTGHTPVRQARRTLDDLAALEAHARQAGRAEFTGAPMVVWGVTWFVAYSALGLLPPPYGFIAFMVAPGLAAALTFTRRQDVRTGWEMPVRRSWLAILLCSPLLVFIVGPLEEPILALFLGGLWAMWMLIYALSTSDLALGAISAGTVALAALVAQLAPTWPHLFGWTAGVALAGLGVIRMAGSRGVRRHGR